MIFSPDVEAGREDEGPGRGRRIGLLVAVGSLERVSSFPA